MDYVSHISLNVTDEIDIRDSVKDVTHFAPLFAQHGNLMMDFGNIIAPEL